MNGKVRIEEAVIEILTAGSGRGFTVLCTVQHEDVLDALARIAGTTGMVITAGRDPVRDIRRTAVRCDPARSVPVRSHVVDAAVLMETADLPDVAEEVRRALVPGGDVRVLLSGLVDVEGTLGDVSIRTIRVEAGVLIARGP